MVNVVLAMEISYATQIAPLIPALAALNTDGVAVDLTTAALDALRAALPLFPLPLLLAALLLLAPTAVAALLSVAQLATPKAPMEVAVQAMDIAEAHLLTVFRGTAVKTAVPFQATPLPILHRQRKNLS